jgi:hypothetical protein
MLKLSGGTHTHTHTLTLHVHALQALKKNAPPPRFDIRIVDKESVRTFVPDMPPEFDRLPYAAATSDLIRTALLAHHGGVCVTCHLFLLWVLVSSTVRNQSTVQRARAHTHTHTSPYTHTLSHTRTHTHTHTNKHTNKQTNIHTRTRARARAHTHTHTHLSLSSNEKHNHSKHT